MSFDEEMAAALEADAAYIEAMGGDAGPTNDDGKHYGVYCHDCTEKHGDGLPVYHAPPACSMGEPTGGREP